MFVAISKHRNCKYCTAAQFVPCRMLGVKAGLLESLVRNPSTLNRCACTALISPSSLRLLSCRHLRSTQTSSQMLRRWNRTKYLAHPEIRRLISSITSSNYVQARCASLPIMEFRDTVHNFVDEARQILERLRTGEGETLSGPDLHILEVQLYLLGREVTKMKDHKTPPPFPPFASGQAKT